MNDYSMLPGDGLDQCIPESDAPARPRKVARLAYADLEVKPIDYAPQPDARDGR